MDLDKVIDLSLSLYNATSMFNDTFSGIFLNLFAYSLILITICLYGAASIILSLPRLLKHDDDGNDGLLFAILRIIYCTVIVLVNAERIVRLTKCTNNLSKSMKMFKRELNNVLNREEDFQQNGENTPPASMENEHPLYVPNKIIMNGNKISILKEELSVHSPIAPFNAFEVSNRTLIGAFATITTYLIVLIQFKISEFN